MRMVRHLAGAAMLVAAVVPAVRAQDAEAVRAAQVNMMNVERRMILGMIDAMPDQFFRERATPAQRDFAMQLYHATSAVPFVARMAAQVPAMTTMRDSVTATSSKDSLRAFVNATFDWAVSTIRAQTAADRLAEANLFGNRMPKWQVWDELHQHTMWTLGQTVANFRAHGMAPPSFMFF